MADNADVTQSQTRDTRYRRMQELNSLCVIKYINSCVTCRLLRLETFFEPILQCVFRYTANRLVKYSI